MLASARSGSIAVVLGLCWSLAVASVTAAQDPRRPRPQQQQQQQQQQQPQQQPQQQQQQPQQEQQPAPPAQQAAGQPAPRSSTDPENANATRQAREHFQRGLGHYRAHQFREAIHEFEQAASLVPSADLWFNIARAHEQLARATEQINEYAAAAENYRRYLRDRVDPPDREQVQAHIAELDERAEAAREEHARRSRPTTGTLNIESSVQGAKVEVGARRIGAAPVTRPVDLAPGRHRLAVSQDGYIPFRSEVRVEAGVTTGAYADLVPATEYRAMRGSRLFTWIVGGLSVATFLTASVLWVMTLGMPTDTPEERADLEDTATASDYILGGAIVLAIGTAVLYFIEGRAVGTETLRGGRVVTN